MIWWCRCLALLLLVGIVLSPLSAVAATIPMLIAYDVPVPRMATVRVAAGPSVRPELGGVHESVYDDAPNGHDNGTRPRVAGGTGAIRTYDGPRNPADRREVGEGVIYDAPTAPTAAEETVSVFHASMKDGASILENGLDAARAPTFASRDLAAAADALANHPDAVEGLGTIIESRIPTSQFQSVLAPSERAYSGFYPYALDSTEITLRTPD